MSYNTVVHWPIAFVPGKGFFPLNQSGEAELDTQTSLVDTWRAMIKLLETGKVPCMRDPIRNYTHLLLRSRQLESPTLPLPSSKVLLMPPVLFLCVFLRISSVSILSWPSSLGGQSSRGSSSASSRRPRHILCGEEYPPDGLQPSR